MQNLSFNYLYSTKKNISLKFYTLTVLTFFFFFFYLFTQDRTRMLEITHTYTPQTTTYTIRMEQPLMMVLTLNCKYYKNIIVQQRKSMTVNTNT